MSACRSGPIFRKRADSMSAGTDDGHNPALWSDLPLAAQSRMPYVRFSGAGWSSPVARQAHNLKVVGSNPTPATKYLADNTAKNKKASVFGSGLFCCFGTLLAHSEPIGCPKGQQISTRIEVIPHTRRSARTLIQRTVIPIHSGTYLVWKRASVEASKNGYGCRCRYSSKARFINSSIVMSCSRA
jgi:hypothetical protein